ncbi:hypothetical protein [Actinoplanes sp. NPDC026623]|uniref:hypothetical protein n=1 Tax=Actinoplanes sp. NPDC026623 TaxID=3155610 RepID=UPI0033DA7FE9
MDHNPDPRLNELSELRERLQVELRELMDTANLADTAVAALEETARALDCTAGWSAVDILGGGSIISMIKNNELDAALDVAAQAEDHLSALRQRLTSTPLSTLADQPHADVITRFADISLDNILVDISVHRQITAAQDQIDSALRNVCDIRAKLRSQIVLDRIKLYEVVAQSLQPSSTSASRAPGRAQPCQFSTELAGRGARVARSR